MTTKDELKTLKEIEPLLYQDDERFYVKIELLKAEAINWVKAMINKAKLEGKEDLWRLSIAYNIFIDFFNLTEEDLKNDN